MVIVEGILVLAMEEVRDQLNMKIYVDTGERGRGAGGGREGGGRGAGGGRGRAGRPFG